MERRRQPALAPRPTCPPGISQWAPYLAGIRSAGRSLGSAPLTAQLPADTSAITAGHRTTVRTLVR